MKLRAVHLLSLPNTEREMRSVADVSRLQDFGIEVIQVVNPPYDGPVPEARDDNGTRPFKLGPRHFGCYAAHREAILQHLTEDLLVFEGDCLFNVSLYEMKSRILLALAGCRTYRLIAVSFGPKHGGLILEQLNPLMGTTTRFIETHAYLIPLSSRPIFEDVFSKPWDTVDYVYTIYLLDQQRQRIGIFTDKIAAVQSNGPSLIDAKPKDSEDHFRNLKGQN